MTREEYKALVRPHLKDKRFYHSECVANEAEKLAKQYGADPEKAWTAGMLHDIMKEQSQEEIQQTIQELGVELTPLEQNAFKLWHAIVGAVYLEKVLQITDTEILDAVRYHTTAKANMTLLEEILFMADYISADRTFPGVEDMRKLAYENLDEAVLLGCSETVQDLSHRLLPIHPDTIGSYNYYAQKREWKQ